jgi:transcription-repair coupling factor (superfamily II helicase)
LLVIDEEHRFGVRHKEKLKQLRTKVDVLTLTATPIPRTLNMAMLSLRDISLINTPPEARRPIMTRVAKFDLQLIRRAILEELERHGQVYFVHNRVQSIYALADMLKKLVPEARFEIAHGQMAESALEKIMMRFLDGDFDVLISTTIIESGLDIPTVNTIIINRADRLGLAQLYQLRGRVGRDRWQAYAYLLVPASSVLTPKARERLLAIREASELGSGFRLATRDMEIRGAGDILGPNQHGHISAVGFDMYCQLIREAISELRGEPIEEAPVTEIKIPCETAIPDEYIAEPTQRLVAYRQFAMLRRKEDIETVLNGLHDQFGEPPVEIRNLAELALLRILGRRLQIEKIEYNGKDIEVRFRDKTPVKPEAVTALLLNRPHQVRFQPPNLLRIVVPTQSRNTLFEHVQAILQDLG